MDKKIDMVAGKIDSMQSMMMQVLATQTRLPGPTVTQAEAPAPAGTSARLIGDAQGHFSRPERD
eukprot:760456-Hanusia_phi.AAC.2